MSFKIAVFVFTFLFSNFLFSSDSLAATVDVTITGANTFSPSSVTINTGDTVRWTVDAGASGGGYYEIGGDFHLTHYLYPDPSCQNDTVNCWDGPILIRGGSPNTYSFTFMIAGTWKYHDHQSNQASGVDGPATIVVNDTRAPAAVSNLASSGATTTTITITWTSPGDDQGNYVNYGTPSVYDVRYSTATITSGNWASATQVSGEPTPSIAGTSESMTASGLSAGTTYYFGMKTRDEVPNESALSNILTRSTADPSDTTAPAAVTNLSLSNPTETSILLSWTAPGDDGNTGTAQSYDVRYSKSAITDSNWSSATQVSGEPSPKAAGGSESITVSGLSSGTTYYFVLKTKDESNNESTLSNVPSLSTITPSSTNQERFGDVTPPGKILDLTIVSVSTSTAEFSWTAPGDDENTGKVAVYDMRYALENIKLVNWPFISKAEGEPAPGVSGTKQSMKISGLNASSSYYFAINAKDEVSNESAFSNVVSTTTLALPPAPLEKKVKEEAPKPEGPPKKEEIVKPDQIKPSTVPLPPVEPPLPPPVFSENELLRAKGDSKVYVVKNGKKLWIPSPEAFLVAGYEWQRIKEVEVNIFETVPAVNLIRAEGHAEVYEVIDNRKRHIPSALAFVREGHKWEDITVVPVRHIEDYSDVKLLRASGDKKVYAVLGGAKRHIPNADVFNTYGYKWEDVAETEKIVLENYEDAPLVNGVEDFKVFLILWVEDLRKALQSSNPLVIAGYNIDVKIYLGGWIGELEKKLSQLKDKNSPFYREISDVSKRGDAELCLVGRVELCLSTKHYAGGSLDTLFKVIDERLL